MRGWVKLLLLNRISLQLIIFHLASIVLTFQYPANITASPLTCSVIYPSTFIYKGMEIPGETICKNFDEISFENPFIENQWPASEVTHLSPKYKASINSRGIIIGIKENYYDSDEPTFEFPVYSGNYYLGFASLWIGGILGEDTLVTTARSEDMEPYYEFYFPIDRKEFYPSSATNNFNAIKPIISELYSGYYTHYVDTFTLADLEGIIEDNDLLSTHKPLNISVKQKTYNYNISPFKNILLLDYIVTNIGIDTIKQTYSGLYVNGDVYKEGLYNTDDDLTGSFRDSVWLT